MTLSSIHSILFGRTQDTVTGHINQDLQSMGLQRVGWLRNYNNNRGN